MINSIAAMEEEEEEEREGGGWGSAAAHSMTHFFHVRCHERFPAVAAAPTAPQNNSSTSFMGPCVSHGAAAWVSIQ